MKKKLKRMGIILLSLIIIFVTTTAILFRNELRSLASIKKVDDYGMFQMTYYGDYGFDQFLAVGAADDKDLEKFVTKRLMKGISIDLNVTSGGCTAFVVKNDNNGVIFGRNFDFEYSPSMQVITCPKGGYTSVSTVNLAFVGYSRDNLPSGLNMKSFLTLAAPFLPFDGMNEMGLAIALLAVPEADPPFDENKVTLNTTTSIRLVLDKAATVDEALELLEQYNIYFSDGIECHFLIADASGKSVLVEYYDKGLQAVTTDEAYFVASNFIAYNGLNIGEGFSEFERYDRAEAIIKNNGGSLEMRQAITLLTDLGVMDEGEDRLQWTAIYNLHTLDGVVFANRNINNIIDFQLSQK